MKTKTEFIGTDITTYHGNYQRTITVTEDMAKQHKYYTSIGLGYLFEESTPKAKYKGVENEEKKEKDAEA
jgi:adenosylmethionine-8-amino-7-oxononanoate aminotransferase